jgi:RNA polymerase sigma factor (sigma-70 family)
MMEMTESRQLLAEYAERGSEAAFRELVERYVNFVYSTAARLLGGDTHRAEDVTQIVFADLARTAGTLSPETMLGGWLHRHTCFVAVNTRRSEWRRQNREREAVEMNSAQDQPDFSRVAPVLDEAINQLGTDDRAAILLRFFEQRDFRRIGEALGSTEDAARMRVNRALEKLGTLLKRRGLTTSAGALATALSANAVMPAPAGLAASITAATALAAPAAVTVATHATVNAMNWINGKTVTLLLAGALASGAGTYVTQQRQAARLREHNQTLLAQQEALARERDQAAAAAAAKAEELDRLQRDEAELVRLRGEVAALREQAKQVQKLKDENRRLQAASTMAPPPAEADANAQQQAVQARMNDAKQLMLSVILYANDWSGNFPTNLVQIGPYSPPDKASLTNQFELVYQGRPKQLGPGVVASTIALRENQPALINGQWCKVYGFIDGHVEYKPEPPEGFAAWEKLHIVASGQ